MEIVTDRRDQRHHVAPSALPEETMMRHPSPPPRGPCGTRGWLVPSLASWVLAPALLAPAPLDAQPSCATTVTAEVVAHDQVIFYNRWGTFDPGGMMFSLMEDVVPLNPAAPAGPGNARVRPAKRPRPLVLRVNEGDCLSITFHNWLDPVRINNVQPITRDAGLHVVGMQVVESLGDDGSYVGVNQSSLAAPGETKYYNIYAERDGTYFLYSTAANVGGLGNGGTIARGLWGAVNVQPAGAEWYRSQLSNSELQLATAVDPVTGQKLFTPLGQPILDYDAVFPVGHPLAGRPIIRILDGTQIVHSDANAIITGPGRGPFAAGTYPAVPSVSGDRTRPYREMTVMFHEAFGIVQAFPEFEDEVIGPVVGEGFDGFGINYVAMGVAATVLANRKGVGPAADCPECMFEEFFLSSWAIGDPGVIPNVFANVTDPANGIVATAAEHAADPGNVFHAYLNDRVVIRNLHAGPTEHHIFHLHAHQWLREPNSDDSEYLDSQAIGPGHGFTYELTYEGAGNRNRTPGDAIMHCHFYPHFASGMWGLLRSHDVFEVGTEVDPLTGEVIGRAVPDGEIAQGGLIPAVLPIPGQPMPLMPTADFPGYPFYVEGRAGHRPPQPPLDMVFDGGLQRHVVVGGTAEAPPLNRLDFTKQLTLLDVEPLPHEGTVLEQKAMAFHAADPAGAPGAPGAPEDNFLGPTAVQGGWTTFRAPLQPIALPPQTAPDATFRVNAAPPAPGAPFADPCIRDDQTTLVPVNRWYKGAAIQLDVKYNKAGWHFPQHRMYSLWDDVDDFLEGRRAPEPFFMRTNTGDCIEYQLKNLVPAHYEQDDFQVRTPTDVMGQHIHLVKFDVMASDGGGNGWNYEDGSLSSGDVRARIAAIRAFNNCDGPDGPEPGALCPVAQAHPKFAHLGEIALGAQATVQRWYTDDVLNSDQADRGLGGIFTHDHFAPSTHQQAGLYGALIQQPTGSEWFHSETGRRLGTRNNPAGDGGPTSWQAIIQTPDPQHSYREFLLMMQDFALAYDDTHQGFGANPMAAINPPGKVEGAIGQLLLPPWVHNVCPSGHPAIGAADGGVGCPELFSADNVGMWTVNYRAEPIALRVRDPNDNTQPLGDRADLALAYQTRIDRPDPRFNVQPNFYPALTGDVQPGDPFTPLLRAYMGDRVRVRTLVGAHEESHHFSMHGARWLAEAGNPNSGWMAGQLMGISEKFEVVLPPATGNIAGNRMDYLWKAGAATESQWSGTWGLLRSYGQRQNNLAQLPSNAPTQGNRFATIANSGQFTEMCPNTAPVRRFNVSAFMARDILPGGALVYNQKFGLEDPMAILYVRDEDIDPATGMLHAGAPVEPLILRANAGDCIDLRLTNRLPAPLDMQALDQAFPGWSTLPMIVYDPAFGAFNSNNVRPSTRVGLTPQLVAYDPTRSEGTAVGLNPNQTAVPEIRELVENPETGELEEVIVQPAGTKKYLWYAGLVHYDRASQTLSAEPAEFGVVNLMSPDRIKHSQKAAVGALVIEPVGATWTTDYERPECGQPGEVPCSRAAATVFTAEADHFREFVLVFQDDISLYWTNPATGEYEALPNIVGAHDPEDSGHKAVNYRTEPLWARVGAAPDATEEERNDLFFYTDVHSSTVHGDPETPIFHTQPGEAVRFRLAHPGGVSRSIALGVHGHGWLERPWVPGTNSRVMGDNPESEWVGVAFGMGPTSHQNLVLTHGAGGAFSKEGDYMYRSMMSYSYDQGIWGILRVGNITGGNGGGAPPPGGGGGGGGGGNTTVATVTVSPTSATVSVGGAQQFSAILQANNGNVVSGTVTWTSSNPAVATVSGTGLATAVTVGSAIITATSENGVTGSASLRVAPASVETVSVDPAAPSINHGAIQQFTALLRSLSGELLSDRLVTWTSSNTSVATVDGSGLATGVGAGTAYITATSEGKTGFATLTVGAPFVATVTVSPATVNISVNGGTQQFTATLRDALGNLFAGLVSWTSSDPSVATVDGNGLVTGGNAGTATITATSVQGLNGSTVSGTATVTVCTLRGGSGRCR
jgi:manganese oxidase